MPGGSNALERPDDPRGRHRGLQRIGLEPLVQEVVGRHRHELHEDRLLALGQLLEAPQQARERQQRSGVDRGRVGGTIARIGLMNRAMSTMSGPYSS